MGPANQLGFGRKIRDRLRAHDNHPERVCLGILRKILEVFGGFAPRWDFGRVPRSGLQVKQQHPLILLSSRQKPPQHVPVREVRRCPVYTHDCGEINPLATIAAWGSMTPSIRYPLYLRSTLSGNLKSPFVICVSHRQSICKRLGYFKNCSSNPSSRIKKGPKWGYSRK